MTGNYGCATSGVHEKLTDSYHRLVASRHFWERFTELFLGRNEAVRRHFDHVPPAHRRGLLQRSLAVLFDHAEHQPGAEAALDTLARPDQKGRQEIPEALYGLWLVSLLQAVKECDPHYSDDLERAWRHAMEGQVACLIRSSREQTDTAPTQSTYAQGAVAAGAFTPIRPATLH